MAFPYVGAGGSSGVNLNDVWPANSARLQIVGFRRGSTIIGVDGFTYYLTLATSAIAAGTAGFPPDGVPAGYLYWKRQLDLAGGLQPPAGTEFVTTSNGSDLVTSGDEPVYAKAA